MMEQITRGKALPPVSSRPDPGSPPMASPLFVEGIDHDGCWNRAGSQMPATTMSWRVRLHQSLSRQRCTTR